jgi:molybdate transport system permease protein
MDESRSQDTQLTPAGSRINVLSVVCLTVLGLFITLIAVLIVSDVVYLRKEQVNLAQLAEILQSPQVARALKLSMATSFSALALVLVVAVPCGYALSRFRFPGRSILNSIVDIPIVLPPIVLGISLLAFFGTDVGRELQKWLDNLDRRFVSGLKIVLCQFLVSVSYCIRSMKAAFDAVDRRLEDVAMSLGSTTAGAFLRVTLPLASSGLVAGGVMAWARAIGVFGPLMVFVGTSTRVEVMPTTMWLELSIGNIEVSLVVALISILLAGYALALVHFLSGGRRWP